MNYIKAVQKIKRKAPKVYNIIELEAKSRWGSNSVMVHYRINKQCKKYFKVMKYLKKDTDNLSLLSLLLKNIKKWSEGTWEIGEEFGSAFIDWDMVVYFYKRQRKAHHELKGVQK